MPFEERSPREGPASTIICGTEYRIKDWVNVHFKSTDQKTFEWRIVRSVGRIKNFITGGPYPDGVGGMVIKDIDGEKFIVLRPNIYSIAKFPLKKP